MVTLDDALWTLASDLLARTQRAEQKGKAVLAERLTSRRQHVLGILQVRRRREQEEEERARRPFREEILYDHF
jgi:hypothetical protein